MYVKLMYQIYNSLDKNNMRFLEKSGDSGLEAYLTGHVSVQLMKEGKKCFKGINSKNFADKCMLEYERRRNTNLLRTETLLLSLQ